MRSRLVNDDESKPRAPVARASAWTGIVKLQGRPIPVLAGELPQRALKSAGSRADTKAVWDRRREEG